MRRRALVVCPDYPIMGHMVREPAPVGALFQNIDGLDSAIAEALAQHEQVRSASAIADLLDSFIAPVLGLRSQARVP